MKKRTATFAIAATALLLASCGTSPEPREVTATETVTHTITPSASPKETPNASPKQPETPHAEPGAAKQETFTPGDPRLVSVDAIGTAGMFMDPDTGQYYVCNGGELTAAEGAPVESGTCAGPFADYYAAGDLTSQLSGAIGGAIESEAVDEGLIDPVDEGDITARFWECMEAGGTEETCRQ